MKDYFTFNNLPFTFVFEPWHVKTALSLGFTCLAIAAIALLFEGIRVFRVWVKTQFEVSPLVPILARGLQDSVSTVIPGNQDYIRANNIRNHIIQTLIHVIRVALSYFLMLAVMTYNAYVAITIVAGAALGYFLFCHKLSKWKESESCKSSSSPMTASTSANSTPPGEEAQPMLNTFSSASMSVNETINVA